MHHHEHARAKLQEARERIETVRDNRPEPPQAKLADAIEAAIEAVETVMDNELDHLAAVNSLPEGARLTSSSWSHMAGNLPPGTVLARWSEGDVPMVRVSTTDGGYSDRPAS